MVDVRVSSMGYVNLKAKVRDGYFIYSIGALE